MRRDVKNTSWHQKVGHDVMTSKSASWRQIYIFTSSRQKVRRDIKKFVVTSKIRHDVKNSHDVKKSVVMSKILRKLKMAMMHKKGV